MSRITYTDYERDLMAALSIRKRQVLNKLARLIGSEVAETPTYRIPLENLIGKGFDAHDSRMILKTVARMRGIVEEAWLRRDSLFVKFRYEALSLLHKMAVKEAEFPPQGDGSLYCEAALTLKRAMGVRSEVWFTLDFDNESFNYGEDTHYLDQAFDNDSWVMGFEEGIGEFLERNISIRPVSNEHIQVVQTVSCKWPSCDPCSSRHLALVPVCDFTSPEIWEKMVPDIAAQGLELLEEAREKTRGMLEVKLDNGTVLKRSEILRRMEDACSEEDLLCKLLGVAPEITAGPEWPLGQEPRAYYRKYSCNLSEFMELHMEKLGQSIAWAVEEFAGSLWLFIFEKKFGIKPDSMDIEDYGPSGVAEDYQKKFPEKAGEIDADYMLELGKATITLAWGLSTENFRSVSAFVNGVLSHPAIKKRELKHLGFSFDVKNMEPQALRKCLNDAERDFLLG